MSANLRTERAEPSRLIDNLKRTLDKHHGQLLKAAKRRWEHNFAGKDPTDACVNVRVRSADAPRPQLPCAGILRKRRRSLLNGSH